MKLDEVLSLADREDPQYSEEAIIDALQSEEPYLDLKGIFDRSFFPKIERWLDKRLAKVEVDPEAKKFKGGILRAKLDKELEKEKGDREYDISTEILARELLSSIDEWNKYENKPKDLPVKQAF